MLTVTDILKGNGSGNLKEKQVIINMSYNYEKDDEFERY